MAVEGSSAYGDDGPAVALEPGRNCYRLETAERLAVLLDGEAYFTALRESLIRARRRIIIVGWDLHSRVQLVRSGQDDELPTALGELLVALLKRNEDLQVHLLLWDWAPIYALEREPLFFGNDPWDRHERLHFRTDDAHPLGASHHQKIVSIDGRVAWCGGLDLGKWRWDIHAHPAHEPRRREPDGELYPPFHDQQVIVDGAAAAALEDVVLDRWHRAGGEALDALAGDAPSGAAAADDETDPWPSSVRPWLQDQQVGIVRTLPEYDGRPAARESERLYLDMIAGARRLIYIENQYLTSRAAREALREVLQRDDPPRVVIVLPKDTGSWLEVYTMDALRVRTLQELREADRHHRLGVYSPEVPGLKEGCMMVHSKLMIVDDQALRIGSSNLSNRSLGLDTECDVAIVAEDAATEAAIRDLRHKLIAMFMWMEPADVRRAEEQAARDGKGLTEAIEALRAEKAETAPDGDNRLGPMTGESDPQWQDQMPDERLVDPDRPLTPEMVANTVAEPEHHPHIRRRVAVGLVILAAFAGLGTVWHFTPLGDLIHPQDLIAAARDVGNSLWGPVVAIGGFLVAALTAVPVTLVVLASVIVFGPALGALIALIGTTVAIFAGYEMGRWLGRNEIEHLVGGRLDRVHRRLSRRGALAMATVRIIPVAPFAILNLVAGAIGWHRREFILGSMIGLAPVIILMALFADWLAGYMERDDLRAIALLVGVGLILFGGLDLLRRVGKRLLTAHPRAAVAPVEPDAKDGRG